VVSARPAQSRGAPSPRSAAAVPNAHGMRAAGAGPATAGRTLTRRTERAPRWGAKGPAPGSPPKRPVRAVDGVSRARMITSSTVTAPRKRTRGHPSAPGVRHGGKRRLSPRCRRSDFEADADRSAPRVGRVLPRPARTSAGERDRASSVRAVQGVDGQAAASEPGRPEAGRAQHFSAGPIVHRDTRDVPRRLIFAIIFLARRGRRRAGGVPVFLSFR